MCCWTTCQTSTRAWMRSHGYRRSPMRAAGGHHSRQVDYVLGRRASAGSLPALASKSYCSGGPSVGSPASFHACVPPATYATLAKPISLRVFALIAHIGPRSQIVITGRERSWSRGSRNSSGSSWSARIGSVPAEIGTALAAIPVSRIRVTSRTSMSIASGFSRTRSCASRGRVDGTSPIASDAI
jgi:hypothetical protein